MKTLFKLAAGAALAGFLAHMLLDNRPYGRKRNLRAGVDPDRSSVDDVPEVQPVQDAEPLAGEPLQQDDLRVAQNAPF
jgi:hypothetical protein